MNQRPTFTLAEAANLVGVSRSSVRRRLDQGAFSNAYKTPRGSGRSHSLICWKPGSTLCQGRS